MASALEIFLRKARRRQIKHAILDQASGAASLAMLGLLVLLLLGTQILNWYWPVLLFTVSFTLGLVRLRNRVPSLYRLAQRVDDRLQLHDTLSTAYHFRSSAGNSVVEFQHRAAEEAAARAELAHAVPTPLPRSCYALVVLFALSATLFAMRYLTMHSLDLKRPLAQIQFGSFFFEELPEHAENRKSAIQERFQEQIKQMGLSLDPVDDRPGMDLPPQAPNSFTATPDGRTPIESNQKAEGPNGTKADRDGSTPEGNEKGQNGSGNDAKDNLLDSLPGLNVNGKEQQGQQNAQKNAPGKSGQSSSMLDKMRDAMADLMAKLKMQNNSQGQQQSSSQNSGTPSSGQPSAQNQRGMQSQNKSNGEGQPNGNPNGEQAQDGADQAQAAASKNGDRSSDRPGGQDSKSGMGKQDGDKSIEDGEQLAAMGKISEIIGKRSAQIQGEMTVEVPSGKQQLKTSYTKKRAAHGDAGGELSREEIPLMLQPYVQRYFDQIRKAPQPAQQRSTSAEPRT